MTTPPTDLYGPIIHPPPGPPGPAAARWLAVVACPLGVLALLATAYLLVWFAWVTLPIAGLAWWLNAHAAARLSGTVARVRPDRSAARSPRPPRRSGSSRPSSAAWRWRRAAR